MKNVLVKMVAVIGLLSISSAAMAIDFNIDNTFATKFIGGTGITWVDGPVLMTTLGTSVAEGDHSFSATYWQVVNLDDAKGYDNSVDEDFVVESNANQVTEWDVFLNYTYSGLSFANISAGVAYYDFVLLPAAWGDETTDVYVNVNLKDVPLNPSFNFSYDTDGDNEGAYGNVAIGDSFEISGQPIGWGAKVVWSSENYAAAYFADGSDDDNSGIVAYNLSLSTSWDLKENLFLGVGVAYWQLTNDDGVLGRSHEDWESLGYDSPDSNTVASISLSATF